MTERPEVVLSDVDGTQIIHGQSLPSCEVRASAYALRANDVPLLEVTSRSHALMRKLIKPLDLQDNLCTLDGGATVAQANSGDIVWSQWLSASSTREVVTGIGRLCTNIHYDMDSRSQDPTEVLDAIEDERINLESAPSVFAVFEAEKSEKIIETLANLAGIKHTPIMGYENHATLRCIQVVDEGVDKQFGIEQMLRCGNLADRRRLAIGDGMNDLPLFAAAGPEGIKVAMGNAPDELKDRADWVAPPVEEHGFAVAIDRYVLR